MPSVLEDPVKFKEALDDYIDRIESTSNERERASYFIEFLRRDCGLERGEDVGTPTEMRPSLEEYISERQTEGTTLHDFSSEEEDENTVFLKGRLDARVGNLIIEFKEDIDQDINQAQVQLKKYAYLLYRQNIADEFICIATDGVKFYNYETKFPEGLNSEEDVALEEQTATRLNLQSSPTEYSREWLKAILRARTKPTIDRLDDKFGVGSSIFEDSIEILEEAFNSQEKFQVYKEEWSNYLRIAQGESSTTTEELFLQHTYLASFAKLLSYLVLTKGQIPSVNQAENIISGNIEHHLPENLFEEDMFSWVGETEDSQEFIETLITSLSRFDLGKVDQDVFKKLYQDMVSEEVRHGLGEYYTPDWLAQHIIQKMDLDSDSVVLDPGCGSGTFLVEAIKKKKDSNRSEEELVNQISEEVVGIDVHPLAVIIAKSNYITAIRELLKYRRTEIRIPVYLADSIFFKEDLQQDKDVETNEPVVGPIEVADNEYFIPEKAISNPSKFDEVLNIMDEYLDNPEGFKNKVQRDIPEFEDVLPIFERMLRKMAEAEEEGRDSIHSFILQNFYRPVFLSESQESRFDALIGNPPWLVYNNMGRNQQNMKTLLNEYDMHPGPQDVSNIELATLFVVRCSDLYLKDDGKLGYVMPRSIFNANQHNSFRKGEFNLDLRIDLVLDLDEVSPLFNVPACSILATKGQEFEYPIDKIEVSGDLGEGNKNCSLDFALDILEMEEGEIVLGGSEITSWDTLPEMERSDYYEDFHEGTHMTPRTLWFAQLQEGHEEWGISSEEPHLETSDYAIGAVKNENSKVRIKSQVESEFIYSTLIGEDIVPFQVRGFRMAVLPIKPLSDSYEVITADQAKSGGYTGLANWLSQAEEVWNELDQNIPTIYDRIDYHEDVSRQNPSSRWKVVYHSRGKNLTCCLVDTDAVEFGNGLEANGFIADTSTQIYETNDRGEAFYLLAILNSRSLNAKIKNLQSKGNFGPRNIHKTPFEFPIPEFDDDNDVHMRLIQAAEQAMEKAIGGLEDAREQGYKATWKYREIVRDHISEELEDIDDEVESLLTVSQE